MSSTRSSFAAFAVVLLGQRRLWSGRRAGRPVRPRGGYRAILGDRVFLRVWALTALLVTAGVAQYAAAFPAYATEVAGLDASWLSLALAANAITGRRPVAHPAPAGGAAPHQRDRARGRPVGGGLERGAGRRCPGGRLGGAGAAHRHDGP